MDWGQGEGWGSRPALPHFSDAGVGGETALPEALDWVLPRAQTVGMDWEAVKPEVRSALLSSFHQRHAFV